MEEGRRQQVTEETWLPVVDALGVTGISCLRRGGGGGCGVVEEVEAWRRLTSCPP